MHHLSSYKVMVLATLRMDKFQGREVLHPRV